jgi:t-SNARE complex subunit (syntaxin)
VETLTIRAATPATGRAMLAALAEFRAELSESSDGREVIVSLGRTDAEIVRVLNALERCVIERGDGAAQIELNGKSYVLHPAPSD